MEKSVSQVISLHEYRCTAEPLTIKSAPPVVSWEYVPGCGRGLIASSDIEAGTVVDFAPAIPVREEDCDATLRQYLFMCHREGCLQPYTGPVEYALVFGPMALCNHADEPNADVCFCDGNGRGLEARLILRHDVREGEEVTIRYTDESWYKDCGRF